MIKSDILVLNGSDAELENSDTDLTWKLQPSDFSNWKNGDQIYLKANSIQFIGDILGTYDDFMNSATIESSVNLENQKNTGNPKKNVLCLVDVEPVEDPSGNFIRSNNSTVENAISFKVSKFEDLTIRINYMDEYIHLSNLNQYFRLILEIQYH